jgi:hypothetical protein
MFESRIDATAHPGLTAASDLLGRNLCQTIPINALRSPSPRDGKLAYLGKIGHEISGEDGYKSCQLSCLNALAQIKEAAPVSARN